jgi:glycosyltransferase involved in cell wall biosynthesis/ubiquinone/menaquinone biosynthesis C-methylase UbiE
MRMEYIEKLLSVSESNYPLSYIQRFNQTDRDIWVKKKAKSVKKGLSVLDVGAGTCPYRSLFKHCDYIAHDFKKYTGNQKLGGTNEYGSIDIESDVCNIPINDGSIDVIICTEVLEHIPEPIEALKEMTRILNYGGKLLLTAPLGSGLHQLPFHYYGGFTPEWYKHYLSKFGMKISEIVSNGGFYRQLAQECIRLTGNIPSEYEKDGEKKSDIQKLFGELIPKYLFEIEDKYSFSQFTVGYHVEANKEQIRDQKRRKPLTNKNNYPDNRNSEIKNTNLVGLIFSKDRALQLDATLSSFYLNCQDASLAKLNVLYKCSSKRFEKQYEILKVDYPDVSFIKENDFKSQTLSIIYDSNYILFMVDDILFTRRFILSDIEKVLSNEIESIGFSLRLGHNTNYCYPLDKEQKFPDTIKVEKNILSYAWRCAEHDFGYPVEVSSSIYRSCDIYSYIKSLEFHNPNTLEAVMYKNCDKIKHEKMLMYDTSVAFGIPLNLVQDVCINRSDNSMKFTADELAKIFDTGEILDVTEYRGHISTAAHQVLPLKFTSRDIGRKIKGEFNTNTAVFSVIMPNYNKEEYIEESIQSVIFQRFQDWELIIVDDGSTDSSIDKIKPFLSDNRISLVTKNKNYGVISAVKTGIEMVTTEIFGILDSDDILHRDAISVMYESHIKNSNVGFAYSQFIICDSNMKYVGIGYCDDIPKGKTNLDCDRASHFKTFKKMYYDKTKGFEESTYGAEDKDISYKMEEVSELLFIDQQLYYYRELPDSQSHDKKKALIGMINWKRSKIQAVLRRDQINYEKQKYALSSFKFANNYFVDGKFVEAHQQIKNYYSSIDYDLFTKIDKQNSSYKDVSVIVTITKKNINHIISTFESLINQKSNKYEVVFVCNECNSEVVDTLIDYNITLISTPTMLRTPEMQNIGTHFAKGKIVTFLHENTIVNPNYIDEIVRSFQINYVHGIRGKIIDKEKIGTDIDLGNDLGNNVANSIITKQNCSAYLKKTLLEFGGMNPFLSCFQDLELSYRIQSDNNISRIIYDPNIKVYPIGNSEIISNQERKNIRQYLSLCYPSLFSQYDERTGLPLIVQ